jgi:hypothetical protein
MSTTQIVSWIVLAVIVFWGVGAYNRLVRLRNVIGNSFAQIDVQLKRRYDLIPNLVEVARKYAAHERETLEAVTAARNQAKARPPTWRAPGLPPRAPSPALTMAEEVLGTAMGKLMALVEAYPELKADQSLRELAERTHQHREQGGLLAPAVQRRDARLQQRGPAVPDQPDGQPVRLPRCCDAAVDRERRRAGRGARAALSP